MAKPTMKQKFAFKELLKRIASGEEIVWKEIMKEAGYSEKSANRPSQVLRDREGWQQLISQVDETPLLAKLYEIALIGGNREAIQAIREIFKVKDRYHRGLDLTIKEKIKDITVPIDEGNKRQETSEGHKLDSSSSTEKDS